MGLRYRKNINLGGGFRVNISKSGIGYSWGAKGYRITKTAQGAIRQTVSIPGTGISYVTESTEKKKTQTETPKTPIQNTQQSRIEEYRLVSTAQAKNFQPPEYVEMFKKMQFAKWLNMVIIICMVLLFFISKPLALLMFVCLAILHIKGVWKIEYEFDPVKQDDWDRFSAAWRAIAKSKKLMQINGTARIRSESRDADTVGLDAKRISSSDVLPFVKTKVKPIVFNLTQGHMMAILPDMLVVQDVSGYGVARYEDIDFKVSPYGMVEYGTAPKDAEIIGQKWQHANKDGSADKRYKNNLEASIAKYARIEITSESGLNIQLLCSSEPAAEALGKIAKRLFPKES